MKTTMFGQMLDSVHKQRKQLKERTIANLWSRNKLNPNAPGYKIAETTQVHADGREVVEYRLYQMIDCSVSTLKADITATVASGIGESTEGKRRVSANRE